MDPLVAERASSNVVTDAIQTKQTLKQMPGEYSNTELSDREPPVKTTQTCQNKITTEGSVVQQDQAKLKARCRDDSQSQNNRNGYKGSIERENGLSTSTTLLQDQSPSEVATANINRDHHYQYAQCRTNQDYQRDKDRQKENGDLDDKPAARSTSQQVDEQQPMFPDIHSQVPNVASAMSNDKNKYEKQQQQQQQQARKRRRSMKEVEDLKVWHIYEGPSRRRIAPPPPPPSLPTEPTVMVRHSKRKRTPKMLPDFETTAPKRLHNNDKDGEESLVEDDDCEDEVNDSDKESSSDEEMSHSPKKQKEYVCSKNTDSSDSELYEDMNTRTLRAEGGRTEVLIQDVFDGDFHAFLHDLEDAMQEEGFTATGYAKRHKASRGIFTISYIVNELRGMDTKLSKLWKDRVQEYREMKQKGKTKRTRHKSENNVKAKVPPPASVSLTRRPQTPPAQQKRLETQASDCDSRDATAFNASARAIAKNSQVRIATRSRRRQPPSLLAPPLRRPSISDDGFARSQSCQYGNGATQTKMESANTPIVESCGTQNLAEITHIPLTQVASVPRPRRRTKVRVFDWNRHRLLMAALVCLAMCGPLASFIVIYDAIQPRRHKQARQCGIPSSHTQAILTHPDTRDVTEMATGAGARHDGQTVSPKRKEDIFSESETTHNEIPIIPMPDSNSDMF